MLIDSLKVKMTANLTVISSFL